MGSPERISEAERFARSEEAHKAARRGVLDAMEHTGLRATDIADAVIARLARLAESGEWSDP